MATRIRFNRNDAVLLRLIEGGVRYGGQITEALDNNWYEMSRNSVYEKLKAFKRRGWVTSTEVTNANNPKPRNVFTLTAEGKKVIENEVKKWESEDPEVVIIVRELLEYDSE